MWTDSDTKGPMEAASVSSSQEEEDEVQVFASVQWLDGYQPQKCNVELSRVLQSWANTNHFKAHIDVVKASMDGNTEIKIKSASALKLLKTLCRQTLTTKEGNRVTVKSVSLTPPEMETEESDDASINLPSSFSSSVSNSQEAPVSSSQEDEFQVFASFQWLDGYQPQKFKFELTKVLQSWINRNNVKINISVVKASKDGNAEIKIKPASALKLLNKLRGKTLTSREGNKITFKSFDLTPPEVETEEPAAASINLPPFFASSVSNPSDAPVSSSQEEEDEFQVFASVQWLDGYQPQKCKKELTKILQMWTSTNNLKVNISVVKASEDGNAEIKIKPASALKLLNKLRGKTLTSREGNKVTFKSFDLIPPEMETEEPAAASMNLSSPSFRPDPQNEEVKLEEQSSSSSSASGPAAAEEKMTNQETCQLPVSHFLYMSHIYKEEMKHIEKKNGVEIAAETTVTFKPLSQKGGDPQKALSEFINLVQKSSAESSGSTVPLKYVDPEQWKETLRIIRKKENKLFVTLSSEELILCGPRQSQDIVTETLNTPERSMESHAMTSPLGHTPPPGASGFNSSVKNSDKTSEGASKQDLNTKTLNTSEKNVIKAGSTWPPQDTSLKTDIKTKDPLTAGLTVEEEDDWKQMMTKQLDDMKTKEERGKDRTSGIYKSIESHTTGGPLHQHQKITTSSQGHTPPPGASGFNSSVKNNQSGGASKQDVPTKLLNTSEKTLTETNMAGSTRLSQNTSVRTDMKSRYHHAARFTEEDITSLIKKLDNTIRQEDRRRQRRQRYRSSHATGVQHQEITTSSISSVKKSQSEGASSRPVSSGQSGGDKEDNTCPICMDTFTNKKQLKCKHAFCEECLDQAKKTSGPICPVCRDVFDKVQGDQPEGTMSWRTTPTPLPGFSQCGTIVISYDIPSGTQTKNHPKPGRWFTGTQRIAYLPDNSEGRDVLKLLHRAFEQKLIFTVGTSRTTGADNQVTWNDISHKTSMIGGPQSFGYPDPDYLSRVREELKAKGIE